MIDPPREEKGDLRGNLHPVRDASKWMKECQCSYTDDHLGFWHLLQPLTNGSEKATQCLAHGLLSIWHWSLAVEPSTYPLAPFDSKHRLLDKG